MFTKGLFLPQKAKNLKAQRINCTSKEAKATGTQFFKLRIFAVVRIYLLSFTGILKRMVSNVHTECKELF